MSAIEKAILDLKAEIKELQREPLPTNIHAIMAWDKTPRRRRFDKCCKALVALRALRQL